MTAYDKSSRVTLSINGADNVGKSTQLRWLSRGASGCHLAGTIGAWDSRWERLAAGDFARWWFADSSTREHVDLVFTSHSARRRGSGAFALEDRGRPMLLALCGATAAVKENRPVENALGRVETLAAEHDIGERREIHVLLRHAPEPDEEARLALAREQRPTSRWYIDYQHALARILDLQARRGDYDQVVLRGDRPILPVQRELRERLRAYGLPVEPLPAPTELDKILVLAGMSESGKSTVGDLLRAEYGWSRLKIGYLLDVAAARAGVTDPYACWDEAEQAEALSEEVLPLQQESSADPGKRTSSGGNPSPEAHLGRAVRGGVPRRGFG